MKSKMLHKYSEIPEAFFNLKSPREIGQIFHGPTLLDLAGKSLDEQGSGSCLFICALAHGNETTSFFLLQKFLAPFLHKRPRHRLLIFFSNVMAASQGLRQMPTGPDYNRIWKNYQGPETNWTGQLLEIVHRARPFAAIDIHNTSGRNPHFACLNNFDDRSQKLAQIFSPNVFYFSGPDSVLCVNLSAICPSLTLECSQSGNEEALAKALELLNFVYKCGPHLPEIQASEKKAQKIYECIASMKISVQAEVSFEHFSENTLQLNPEIENYNFLALPQGIWLARGPEALAPKILASNTHEDLSANYLERRGDEWRVKKPYIPAMVSDDPAIIKSDCWGYILHKYI